jgi:hypothetical protein
MPKYLVSRRFIEDYEVVVEADNEDDVYDIIADGVEWTFLQSDDEGLIIEEITKEDNNG